MKLKSITTHFQRKNLNIAFVSNLSIFKFDNGHYFSNRVQGNQSHKILKPNLIISIKLTKRNIDLPVLWKYSSNCL